MSTWFPPLPGDEPNEPIVPIGQTEDETPTDEEIDAYVAADPLAYDPRPEES